MLTAELPGNAAGDITIDVRAANATGTVAIGHKDAFRVRPGESLTVYVPLTCVADACDVDAGVPPDGDVARPRSQLRQRAHRSRRDLRHGHPAWRPGCMPALDCADGIGCTKDDRRGSGCTAVCEHTEIRERRLGDLCCPAEANHLADADCPDSCGDRIIQPGELCDRGFLAGEPGACPGVSDCAAPPGSCEVGLLVSEGTCSAVCVRWPIVEQSGTKRDGCCPAGATNATDTDCPILCGNGVVEEKAGERCDPGIPPLSPGSCATNCDDSDACTDDFFAATGCQRDQDACQHPPIKALISGDGCCPGGATHATDTDCAFGCGNGVVDPGEACDKEATGVGACPSSCPTSRPTPCLQYVLHGEVADCSARCVLEPVTECSRVVTWITDKHDMIGDKCCPSGCTGETDVDCSPSPLCGDTFLQGKIPRETCDIGAVPGAPEICPTTCASDDDACTDDRLVSAGTCHAMCVYPLVTTLRAGDGCCPANVGGHMTLDPDCKAKCGDGFVDPPVETCDSFIPGSCPDACPSQRACTLFELRGRTEDCNAWCEPVAITDCSLTTDHCCPAGCTALNDADCPTICGDGAIETTETCDRAITAGKPGACPATCDDRDACTVDVASGSATGCTRSCIHHRITGCVKGDGCCPLGCPPEIDDDCGAVCGDSRVGSGETCDPPATCPGSCPDDGDACTVERMEGAAQSCTAACVHAPITACSGSAVDFCCPTGCTFATDTDC